MDEVDIKVQLILTDDVSDASRFSLAVQLGEVIAKAIEENELELPDGEIEDFIVHCDPELDFA